MSLVHCLSVWSANYLHYAHTHTHILPKRLVLYSMPLGFGSPLSPSFPLLTVALPLFLLFSLFLASEQPWQLVSYWNKARSGNYKKKMDKWPWDLLNLYQSVQMALQVIAGTKLQGTFHNEGEIWSQRVWMGRNCAFIGAKLKCCYVNMLYLAKSHSIYAWTPNLNWAMITSYVIYFC